MDANEIVRRGLEDEAYTVVLRRDGDRLLTLDDAGQVAEVRGA